MKDPLSSKKCLQLKRNLFSLALFGLINDLTPFPVSFCFSTVSASLEKVSRLGSAQAAAAHRVFRNCQKQELQDRPAIGLTLRWSPCVDLCIRCALFGIPLFTTLVFRPPSPSFEPRSQWRFKVHSMLRIMALFLCNRLKRLGLSPSFGSHALTPRSLKCLSVRLHSSAM
jgi:hypothetical protein